MRLRVAKRVLRNRRSSDRTHQRAFLRWERHYARWERQGRHWTAGMQRGRWDPVRPYWDIP